MQKTIVLFALLAACVLTLNEPAKPLWDKVWTANFKETNKGGPAVSGIWWYDANTIRMRTDRVTGKYDEMHCGNEDTHCVVLTDNKFAWVYKPLVRKCCTLCSVEQGCGIIRYDWLRNATYQGTEMKNGVSAEKWYVKGGEDNYYWRTADGTKKHVELDAEPRAMHTMWDVKTYSTKAIDQRIFALPAYCDPTVSC